MLFRSEVYSNEIKRLKEQGVLMGSLKEFSKTHPELIEKYYNKIAKNESDSTVAFNTAFAQDGFFLYVPKNVVIDKAIQLINVMHSEVDYMANSRNLRLSVDQPYRVTCQL